VSVPQAEDFAVLCPGELLFFSLNSATSSMPWNLHARILVAKDKMEYMAVSILKRIALPAVLE
jgi:hypothetical protein